ncbi:hypothetical protein PHMEG_0004364 [Phytophthora megakarya]|uniref:Uncharacterized protein n=1 Tax=Phytophthora megakarya TaxID=4795 RepID=A0A225WVN0_9STRA|nr:hypothetical protein PHMEG_0004364 [Phytophthora megakarya]
MIRSNRFLFIKRPNVPAGIAPIEVVCHSDLKVVEYGGTSYVLEAAQYTVKSRGHEFLNTYAFLSPKSDRGSLHLTRSANEI